MAHHSQTIATFVSEFIYEPLGPALIPFMRNAYAMVGLSVLCRLQDGRESKIPSARLFALQSRYEKYLSNLIFKVIRHFHPLNKYDEFHCVPVALLVVFPNAATV